MKHIFIIAGEASGDLIGARLMHALKKKKGADICFSGIGGPQMQAVGLTSLFPMSDLSTMGLVEVVKRLPLLIRRINQTVRAIEMSAPDAVVTIDVPDFSFRVQKKIQHLLLKKIHYVAPTVWAWRPGRAADCADFLDHMLTLFPFEPPYFAEHYLNCTFVGHPLVENDATFADGPGFRRMVGMDKDAPLLCLLPGSREGEVTRHAEIFAETYKKLTDTIPGLLAVVPSFPHLMPALQEVFERVLGPELSGRVYFTDDTDLKYGAMAASDVALAASGTVTLELALLGIPTIVAYKVNALTAFLGKRLIRIKYASLVNILMNREVIPEFLQENCSVQKLSAALDGLFRHPEKRRLQIHDFKDAMDMLRLPHEKPSEKAAEVILRVTG